MEEEMAAASAQMKAREEEKLAKETPSVRSVYDGPYPYNEIFDSLYLFITNSSSRKEN